MLTKDLAICIRATDFSETSQIVTFFTRANGKISAIARGSKRPRSKFDGPIEVFAQGEIVFADSNKEKLATLTEFQQQGFTNLINNTFTLNCCLFAVELINSMTDDYDPHLELFDSFLSFLQNANEHRVSSISTGRLSAEHQGMLSLLILFQLTLLKEVGLIPVFDACVNCKRMWHGHLGRVSTGWKPVPQATSNDVYFSSAANGFICKDCEHSFPDKIRLSSNAVDCLSNLKSIADADEKTLREIEKVLIRHFTELIGKPPKMAKHILIK